MTDFFKINPIAIRHCILYEFLRENPIEPSFIALRMTVGPGVIKKEEFQVWFDNFNQGVFDINDDKRPITDMREVLRSDKHALRACILYESIKFKLAERGYSKSELWPNNESLVYKIKRNPSFFLFNHFCQVTGDDVMEYREFDFWFYRFSNGEYILNYEREEDKKIHELMNMPNDVMENIKQSCKNVSILQTFVDDQKIFHKTAELSISHFEATVLLSNLVNIHYVRNYLGCKRIFKVPNRRVLNIEYAQHNTGYVKRINKRETVVEGVTFWKQALQDFKGILKNPKLHLNTLEIRLHVNDEHVLNDLKDELKFTHYLNVKNVILNERSWELVVKIVPMLKPGYLTTIDIFSTNPNEDSMEKVFETEQWKRAECFFMAGKCFVWPLRHLYHFVDFEVHLEELSVEDVRQMKEVLFKSPDFEKGSFIVFGDINVFIFEQEFGNALREDPLIYHYPIPNSTEYFEIKVGGWTLEVQRQMS